MFEDRDDFYVAMWLFSGVVAGIVGMVLWIYYWGWINPNEKKIQAHENWREVSAKVIKTSDVRGSDPQNLFRIATVSFKKLDGQPHTHDIAVRHTTTVGSTIEVVTSKQGSFWIEDDISDNSSSPLNASDMDHKYMIFLIFPPILFGIAFGLAFLVVLFITAVVVSSLWWVITKPRLVRLAARKVWNVYKVTRDSVRLRYEFFRRNRRTKATKTYKNVRRFQAELARMDSTPPVIAARRKANELLTRVIQRENMRADDISAVIDGIREDIELDFTAREQARQELADKQS